VSDWGGRLIPESVRDDISEGNIARICMSCYDDRWGYVIYVRLLKKVRPMKLLAQVLNMYCSEYEDLALQIHVDAVTEIPLHWEGNENLDEKYSALVAMKTRGYAMTGLGAVTVTKEPLPTQNSTDDDTLNKDVQDLNLESGKNLDSSERSSKSVTDARKRQIPLSYDIPSIFIC